PCGERPLRTCSDPEVTRIQNLVPGGKVPEEALGVERGARSEGLGVGTSPLEGHFFAAFGFACSCAFAAGGGFTGSCTPADSLGRSGDCSVAPGGWSPMRRSRCTALATCFAVVHTGCAAPLTPRIRSAAESSSPVATYRYGLP